MVVGPFNGQKMVVKDINYDPAVMTVHFENSLTASFKNRVLVCEFINGSVQLNAFLEI